MLQPSRSRLAELILGPFRRKPGTYSRDVLETFACSLVVTGLTFVSGSLLGYLLGPERRGELAAIQALPMMIGGAGLLGMQEAIIYYGGRERHRLGTFVASATTLALLASAPIIVIAAWFMPRFLSTQSAEVVSASRVFLGILVVNALGCLSVTMARGAHDVRWWNVLRLASPVLWVGTVGAYVLARRPDPGAIAITYLGVFFMASLMMAKVTQRRIPVSLQVRPSTWGRLLRYGTPALLGGAPQLLGARIDQLLIAGFLPATELGFYVVGVSWASVAMLPGTAMSGVLFSKIAGMRGFQEQIRFASKAASVSGALSVVVALMLGFAAPLAIPLVYSSGFREAVPLAWILLAAAVFNATSRTVLVTLNGLGRPAAALWPEWSAIVVIVVGAGGFVPSFGAVAAAVAILAGAVVRLLVGLAVIAYVYRSFRPHGEPEG